MKSFFAFLKKEWLEQIRGGKLLVLFIIFVLFGIMNPAIAKLTPWMMEMLSDTLTENGIIITQIEVNALTSWTQFYKNIPMALIIFVLMFSSSLTGEYQKGTLIPVLTKGLSRWKVICSKTLTMLGFWAAGFALTTCITFGYNAIYWDNSVVSYLLPSVFYYFLFGVWIISLIMLFSSISSANTGVLLGTGGCFFGLYLVGMIPKFGKYFPTKLSESMTLLTSQAEPKEYMLSLIITLLLILGNAILAIVIFNKRKL